jgi:RNA polymerase sigma-70 factor (family 1)
MRLLPATPERRREEHGPEPLTARDLGWADGIRSGDGAAFERLFKTYYATLCHFARTYVRGEDECREVVQEVFLRIWEKRQVWHPSHSVRMYLYRAVRNKALNHVRYQRMRGHAAVFGEEDGPEPSLSGEQDVLERIDSESLRTAIESAVEEMPERRRTVYLLHRAHGFTYAEISAIMGTSPKTVANQISEALHFLRGRIAHHLI